MSRSRAAVLSIATGLVAMTWFGLWSLARWFAGATGAFDLGLFAQAVDAVSRGKPLYSDIRGLPVLAEHFSPSLALLAVPWHLWPDPRVLLVTQAGVLATCLGLMVHEAGRRFSALGSLGFALLGLMSYGILGAVEFDFHKTTLAALFVTLCMLGLMRARFPWVAVGAVGLVLTKEDLVARC